MRVNNTSAKKRDRKCVTTFMNGPSKLHLTGSEIVDPKNKKFCLSRPEARRHVMSGRRKALTLCQT